MDGDTVARRVPTPPVSGVSGPPSSAGQEDCVEGRPQDGPRREDEGGTHRVRSRAQKQYPPHDVQPPDAEYSDVPRRGRLANLGASLLEVVLPVQCVGCGQWDTLLCAGCAALAGGPARWDVLDGPTRSGDLGLWSLGEYAGRLRGIVLAAKHRPAVDLAHFLGRAGRTLGHGIAVTGVLAGMREVWVVPAPSGWRRRYRDQMVAPVIADGVAREVAVSAGIRTRVVEPVALRPFTGSQSGRSGGERRSGRLDSMVTRLEVPAGVGVVLADDVVTTGATLRELARVCGPGTVAAATLCRVGGQGQGTEGTSPDLGPYDLGHPGDV